jgi:hypothetical protein
MTHQRDAARLEGEAVRMVTRMLQDRGEADDEPLAATIVAALKGIGFRPTAARSSPGWRPQGGSSPATISAADREWVLAQAAEAAARQAAKARARVRAAGADPDGGGK